MTLIFCWFYWLKPANERVLAVLKCFKNNGQ